MITDTAQATFQDLATQMATIDTEHYLLGTIQDVLILAAQDALHRGDEASGDFVCRVLLATNTISEELTEAFNAAHSEARAIRRNGWRLK